ncbi:MAG: hypothetical protein WDO15_17400 [Bacteroidota bacterium]
MGNVLSSAAMTECHQPLMLSQLSDTNTDEIVRVMPSGVLPKMIAASPDNRYVAVHIGATTR